MSNSIKRKRYKKCAICVKIPKSLVIIPMIDLEPLKLLTQTTN